MTEPAPVPASPPGFDEEFLRRSAAIYESLGDTAFARAVLAVADKRGSASDERMVDVCMIEPITTEQVIADSASQDPVVLARIDAVVADLTPLITSDDALATDDRDTDPEPTP